MDVSTRRLALADVREELAAGSEPDSGEITGPHGIRVKLLRQQALTRYTHSAGSARAYNDKRRAHACAGDTATLAA